MSALVIECPQFKADEKPKTEGIEMEKFTPKEPKQKLYCEDDADLWTMLMSEWGERKEP